MASVEKDTSEVEKYKSDFESFFANTEGSRAASKLTRDFYDQKQWTTEELKILQDRNQVPVQFDYIAEQIDWLTGMQIDSLQDPKAFPRNQDDEGAAQAVTDALRYVSDNTNLQDKCSDSFEEYLLEGVCASIIEVSENSKGEFIIDVNRIPWDRLYYDTHSRNNDFSDIRWAGQSIWMDVAEAQELYPEKSVEIEEVAMSNNLTAGEHDDRGGDKGFSWADKKNKRIRICQHYFLEKDVWHMVHFSGELILFDKVEVGLKDAEGEPAMPIKIRSAYVDRENNRYGYGSKLVDPQREINARRSKGLFLLSSKQIILEEGAVTDPSSLKRELKKPDGVAIVNPGALTNGQMEILPSGDMASGQMAMYQDAVNKMDRFGANASMQGDVDSMSGVALGMAQAGGSIQLRRLMNGFKAYKLEIYRGMWGAIKQHWDAEKWVRVTDSEDNLKWVGLNQNVTLQKHLEELTEDGDAEAQDTLQRLQQAEDPRLGNVIEIRNQVAQLDIDVILDENVDTINAQQQQFVALTELARVQPDQVPFEVMLELSAIDNKRQIKDMLKGDKQQARAQAEFAQLQQQLQDALQQLEMAGIEADNANTVADTQLKVAKAQEANASAQKDVEDTRLVGAKANQVELENRLLVNAPDITPQVFT